MRVRQTTTFKNISNEDLLKSSHTVGTPKKVEAKVTSLPLPSDILLAGLNELCSTSRSLGGLESYGDKIASNPLGLNLAECKEDSPNLLLEDVVMQAPVFSKGPHQKLSPKEVAQLMSVLSQV